VKKKGEVLAPSTVESTYRYVSNIFSTAVKDGVIAKSPCFDIDLPTVVKPRVKPMATEQVEALLNAMPARYRALAVLGAGAGLRQGEAFGVTVPHVSFSERVLHVEQQLQQLIRQPPFLKAPKRESHRDIPLPDPVLDVLAWHMTEFPPTRLMTGIRGSEELLLFTDENGGPLRRTDFSRVWVPAREAAKLPQTITFHDLRHYYASLLIAKGHSVKAVQARLGHKTAQETLDTYGHLWPDHEELTRDAVGTELRQALTVCRVQAAE
jgi:integrase